MKMNQAGMSALAQSRALATGVAPMELLIVGLIVLAFYIFIRVLSNFGAWMSGARYRAYRQLAAQYHGRYESRGLAESPTVSFTHNGATIRVGLAPTIVGQAGQIPRTRVVARFQTGIPFRMELAPIARPAPPQPPKGTRPLRTGDPEFDGTFFVQANDLDMARDFLGPAIRRAIANLQSAVHPGGMLVSVNPERMLVQIDRNLGVRFEALSWAVRESLTLHDGLVERVSQRVKQGIDIVDDAGALEEDHGPPTCKVCGEPIAGLDVVLCSVCNTPHHRDCWEYVGACSIYGCNGTVGVRG
jgi:hypothetical protein